MSEANTQLNLEKWDQVELFHQGDDYFSHMLSNIRRAQSTITIETYIFAVDKVTQIILAELGQAVKRGCTVKILVDGFGSYYWISSLEKICSEKKINLRVYHPLPDTSHWLRKLFNPYFFATKSWQLLKKLNRRDHRKITIIDNNQAYLGSLNFTQLHSEKAMGLLAWRDTGVFVTGSPVKTLSEAFNVSWRRSHQKVLTRFWKRYKKDKNFQASLSLIRLNSTPRKRFRLYRDLLKKIRTSEKQVFVATAYFLPRGSLLKALKKAAARGVSVELIVPGVTDIPPSRWAALEVAKTLLKSNVKVLEYQKRILHAKYMIIDDYVAVGSLNLNHRSFLHDLEVEVVLPDPKEVTNMKQQWLLDRANCIELTLEKLNQQSWIIRLLSRIAFKLRYLL